VSGVGDGRWEGRGKKVERKTMEEGRWKMDEKRTNKIRGEEG